MNTLMIAHTPIRQDAEGRYSLNDLHRAAGGVSKRLPSIFIRTPKAVTLTQRITAEDGSARLDGTPAMFCKKKSGAYVCKELMLAYAQWISPEFHRAVTQALEGGSDIEPEIHAFKEAWAQQYRTKCARPSLDDILNGFRQDEDGLPLAQRIHSAWGPDDAALGASIRAWFKKDFLEIAKIEAWEAMERYSDSPETRADNACNEPMQAGEAA